MVQKTAERLSQYLCDKLDDGLRTVVVVREDRQDIHYLRDDLRTEYNEQTYAQVVQAFRLDESVASPDIDDTPVGERRAVVHYHENAFVLQFPFSETESILISISPETGRNLLQFIEECRRIVQDGG